MLATHDKLSKKDYKANAEITQQHREKMMQQREDKRKSNIKNKVQVTERDKQNTAAKQQRMHRKSLFDQCGTAGADTTNQNSTGELFSYRRRNDNKKTAA